MTANSVPDRPFATRADHELDAAITLNQSQQLAMAKDRSDAGRRVLAQLKRRMAELVAERNARADMQQLPF